MNEPGNEVYYILLLIVLYFLPYLIADFREHHNRIPILITNVLFGWTVIGWIICLIWSYTNIPAPQVIIQEVYRDQDKNIITMGNDIPPINNQEDQGEKYE